MRCNIASRCRIAIVTFALAFARPAWGEPAPWTAADTGFQLAFTTVVALDVWQTVSNRSPTCPAPRFELNPMLGRCPSAGVVFAAGFTAAFAHATVAYLLPQPYRRVWQVTWIGIESAVVARNFTVGVRLSW